MSTQEPTGGAETFADLARAFVSDPREQTLSPLRRAILLDPSFDPLVPVAGTIATATEPRELLEALGARMPSLLLSPSAHAARSRAFEEIGEESSAKVESLLAELSLEALRSSGDGTDRQFLLLWRSGAGLTG